MSEEIVSKVKGPAVGLIITSMLNAFTGLYLMASTILQYNFGAVQSDFTSEAEKIGFYVGFWGTALAGLIGLIIAPIILVGGIRMMKLKAFGFTKATAILAIIPITSCCFLAGIPFGIWALVVLRSPDVMAAFDGGASDRALYPPGPPQQGF